MFFIEIEQQAFRLGIDLTKELHLLYIAEQCLHEPLPSNWLPWYFLKPYYYVPIYNFKMFNLLLFKTFIYVFCVILFRSYIIKENKYFYYNTNSKTSQWEHPLDEHYRQIVEKTRSEDSSTGELKKNNIYLFMF